MDISDPSIYLLLMCIRFLQAGLEPGQIVKGEVILVDDNGMLVRISKTTNAFVANEHISDLGEKQGKLKYKAGSKVVGRVLNVDPVKRKTTLSLQKSLLTSKTKPITSLEVGFFTLLPV